MLTVLSSIESFLVAAWRGISGHHPAGASGTRVSVVALLVEEQDRKLLADICQRLQWDVYFAGTCQDASDTANRLHVPIIVCDRDLRDIDWRDVVRDLAASQQNACVVLISKVIDAYLWNEVVHEGGYDVLSKPLREADVVRVVKLAWSYWNSIRK